jgi:tRNA(fMet)-specific endonuclease VapC
MSSYLLDTSAYSQLVRGHAEMAKIVQQAEELVLSLVTVAELRYGFALGSRQLDNEKMLERFLGSKKVRLLVPDQITVDEFTAIGVQAKKTGTTLAHHDLWLAAQAVQHGITLVSFDKDFTHIKHKGFSLKFLKATE